MGRTGLLTILCFFVILLDFYCYKAILAVFKSWTQKTITYFSRTYWIINGALIIGVFCAIYLNLFLTFRAVILVAFFLITVGKLFMLPFLLIDDLRRLVIKLKGRKEKVLEPSEPIPGDPISRSKFLVNAGLVVGAVPLTSLSWGIISGAYDYKIKHVKLVLPNLPKAFDGIKLGQISDIHSGSFYNKTAVKGGVELLLAQKPDFIFFTGDLVNNVTSEMKDYQDIFTKVKAPLGVYSVLGNHDYGEYYFGKESSAAKTKNLNDLIATHKIMGWDLLMNQNRRLKVDGEEIGILGIENWGMGRFPKYGRMDLATQNTDDLPVKLLLSHDPSHWRGQVLPKYPQIDAMFSGHTHGMQFGVRLKHLQWSPIQYIYKEWAGLYRSQQQQLYVNVGYGFLGYPGRVGILPEITIFELKRS
ncbi:metallophosphoesterase [Pedobacter montanisoli]|uniref:Metallophosphoesterase n=1 Tax=Pedobacter montanisoli TaxID=2923277 RepID=A0ABS9ZSA0_9SPHI|nr:metallophosphoesterase [Pedobacter montanisoli]MCJ0741223.1 metallophosphoesterase [Pedobacter montanisoli]